MLTQERIEGDHMTTTTVPEQVEQLSKEITALISEATLTVKTEQDCFVASDWLARIRKKRKDTEQFFTDLIKPFKEAVKQHQATCQKVLEPLSTAEAKLSTGILDYRRKAQEEAARQQAKLNEQHDKKVEKAIAKGKDPTEIAPAPIVSAPVKTVETEAGAVSARKIKKWRLVDAGQVPKEYWMLDEAKIGKVVRAGAEIPGIQTYEEEVLSVR